MGMQTIGIGATADDGTGDKPRTAGSKINANFTELYRATGSASSLTRPVLLWAGDSKAGEGGEAARWVQAKYRLDVRIETLLASNAVGGSDTGSGSSPAGMTNATRLAAGVADIAARVALGQIVFVVLTIGTNDAGGGIAAETSLANIEKVFNAWFAAGLSGVILMSVDPRTNTVYTSTVGNRNNSYREYRRGQRGILFADTTPYLTAPTDIFGTILGAGTDVAGSASADGLHLDSYGVFQKALALEKPMLQMFAQMEPRSFPTIDVYSATNTRGNLMNAVSNKGNSGTQGGTGRHLDIGGDASTWSPGAGTPPLGWTATVNGYDGSLSISFSKVLCALWNAYTGIAGAYGVQIAFSGTPTSSGSLILERRPTGTGIDPSVPVGGIELEAAWLFEASSLAGITGISISTVGTTPAAVVAATLGTTTNGSKSQADRMPAFSGLFEMVAQGTTTSGTSPGLDITIGWHAGGAVSGSLITIGAGLWPKLALPTPTP